MILAYYGIEKSEDDLIYACNCMPYQNQGTDKRDLVRAAKEFGFIRSSLSRLNIDELKSTIEEGFYPIAYIVTEVIPIKQMHSVVVAGIEKDFIRLLDPGHPEGEYIISLEAFLEKWELARNLTIIIRR